LTHWFDFSTGYGTEELTKIQSFTDIMNNATGKTVNNNVAYKPNVQNGLGAIYIEEEKTSLEFSSSKVGQNPEVFLAYRVVCQCTRMNNHLGTNISAGLLFGDQNPNGY